MRVLPCGAHALLLEFDALDEVLAAHARLRGEVDAELVPAARTLLVTARGIAGSASALASLLADELGSAAEPAGREVEVPVIYDGDDLAEVARLSGLSVREVIEAQRKAIAAVCDGLVGVRRTRWDVRPGPTVPATLEPAERRLERSTSGSRLGMVELAAPDLVGRPGIGLERCAASLSESTSKGTAPCAEGFSGRAIVLLRRLQRY